MIRSGYKFGIQTDAARSGLETRLYQYRGRDKRKFTVVYACKLLKETELNYTITELEGLALVWALRKWHTLLLGWKVKIHTNHKALQFLETYVRNNTRIARRFAFLQEFDLDIIHLSGKSNTIADTLSRNTNSRHKVGDDRYIAIQKATNGVTTHDWTEIIGRAQRDRKPMVDAANGLERRDVIWRDELI